MTITVFQKLIWDYYLQHKRRFPWRETHDPYCILVSEIMLQQTQAARVEPKYILFLEKFPTVEVLSQASTAEVLQSWQGLGYNRRALNLKRCAERIVSSSNGKLPTSFDQLLELPGIGQSTAGAIMAYAHNEPVVFIETNIRRVFLHCFFADKQHISDKELLPLISKTVSQDKAREWYWALMDYGAMLAKIIDNPNRRSAHYSKQSAFAGSKRQLRGSVIRTLTDGPLTVQQLSSQLDTAPGEVTSILQELAAEGFLTLGQNKVSLNK